MKSTQPALVWKFHDAPVELQALSTHGGDEDWLIEIPPDWIDLEYGLPHWMDRMHYSYDPELQDHPAKPNWKILIGSHS